MISEFGLIVVVARTNHHYYQDHHQSTPPLLAPWTQTLLPHAGAGVERWNANVRLIPTVQNGPSGEFPYPEPSLSLHTDRKRVAYKQNTEKWGYAHHGDKRRAHPQSSLQNMLFLILVVLCAAVPSSADFQSSRFRVLTRLLDVFLQIPETQRCA